MRVQNSADVGLMHGKIALVDRCISKQTIYPLMLLIRGANVAFVSDLVPRLALHATIVRHSALAAFLHFFARFLTEGTLSHLGLHACSFSRLVFVFRAGRLVFSVAASRSNPRVFIKQ